VNELKGDNRPINNQSDRKLMLESLKYVDQVELFDTSEELIEILKAYRADIMVKGSDYQGKSVVGKHHCEQVIYYDRISGYSTTNTIQRISDR